MGLSDCPTTMGDSHTVCEYWKGLFKGCGGHSHTLVLASAPAEFADTQLFHITMHRRVLRPLFRTML